MKWLLVIIILVPGLLCAEMIEVPREELMEYLARMEKNKVTIEQLTISNLQLQQEKTELEQSVINLESRMNVLSRNKIFVGGNFGYPLLNIDCMLLYQFGGNGLYLLGGYNRGFNINVGYVRRL
ncbi:hypothetical protein LCGC14_1086870 [marine sediment metagenome]|uniref:Uncharacterized protein n=1 Tax=marine sediment metagenome TaxID=412755 RepID=A0A0F9MDQ7_9ZZZZ